MDRQVRANLGVARVRLIGSFAFVSLVVGTSLLAGSNSADELGPSLPIVLLNTEAKKITQGERFAVLATVICTERGRSLLSIHSEYRGRAEMNIRGNSSRAHPKKAYRLELQDEDGADLKVALLGLPAESDWILLPCYTDKTLIRDRLAHDLWRAMGHYAPRSCYVEVFIKSRRLTSN